MNLRPYRVEVLGTPEAGKTTTIKEVISSLDSKGYNVNYVRESAEVVPSEFAKGSVDAHIWMRLHTAQALLHSYASSADIIIADRGTIDTFFWNHLYFLEGKLSKSQCDAINNFFKSLGYLPDFVIIFTTSAEEAIARRGGEGRIVTKEFIEHYNSTLETFCEKCISVPKYEIDTTHMSIGDVIEQVENAILQHFNNA